MTKIPAHVLCAFKLIEPFLVLEGGTRYAYRAGDLVVKQMVSTSFENPHTFQLVPWLAEQLTCVNDDGFRLSRPVQSVDGEWIVEDG